MWHLSSQCLWISCVTSWIYLRAQRRSERCQSSNIYVYLDNEQVISHWKWTNMHWWKEILTYHFCWPVAPEHKFIDWCWGMSSRKACISVYWRKKRKRGILMVHTGNSYSTIHDYIIPARVQTGEFSVLNLSVGTPTYALIIIKSCSIHSLFQNDMITMN